MRGTTHGENRGERYGGEGRRGAAGRRRGTWDRAPIDRLYIGVGASVSVYNPATEIRMADNFVAKQQTLLSVSRPSSATRYLVVFASQLLIYEPLSLGYISFLRLAKS